MTIKPYLRCRIEHRCQSIWYAEQESQCFLTYWIDHPILFRREEPTFSKLQHWVKVLN
ncbi:hypothetical protein Ciccas_014478, partial [Cichlidogyrus casuarinus]